MKRSRLRIILAAFAICLMTLLMPAAAFADSGGYSTDEYNVDIQTDENHVFHVQEDIHVYFHENRHGIYRYIPKGGSLYEIKNVRVYGYDYETYTENNSLVVKIGSGDYYVYGDQNYRITYDIVGYKDTDESKDTLAIDLIPTGWGTAIDSAKATITFPKEIKDVSVHSGAYQDVGDQGYFSITNKGKELTAVSKGELPQGVGLTIQADLPEGYWVNPKDRSDAIPVGYGILGAIAALMLGLWAFVGRDKAVIKPVEFYPPEEMDPLQVDYIANDNIESKDIAAQFMYFANKGYLRVIQEDKKKFTVEKTGEIAKEEKNHAKILFRKLFSTSNSVNLKDLPSGFGEAAAKIDKDVKASFGKGMRSFTRPSVAGRFVGTVMCFLVPLAAGFITTYSTFMGFLGYAAFVILALLIGLFSHNLVKKVDSFPGRRRPVKLTLNAIVLLALIASATALIFSRNMIMAAVFLAGMMITLIATIFVRQRANNDLYGRVLGFRNFIKTAEYDRLKTLSDEDPEYYFNIMPYAFIFGMSTKWADKFADFKIPQPSWYDSRGGTYDPFFTTYMFSSWSHGINSSVGDYYKSIGADIAGDVVGGGGGGGFSGGGFGGGGGGSW